MNIDKEKSPEFVYTRACLESELSHESSLPVPPKELNWESWVAFLQSQRLAAYFYSLSNKYDDYWPASIQEELRHARYINLLNGDEHLKHISELLTKLNEAHIPTIVLKGWALIQTLYHGDHAQRYCEDIDILIKPGDIEAASILLKKLGYIGEKEVWPGSCRRYTNQRIFRLLGKDKNNSLVLGVGLHWGLFHIPSHDPKRLNVGPLFNRSCEIVIADQKIKKLNLEDEIVYLACHLELHHRDNASLRHYFEIALLISLANGNINWKRVIKLAKEWQHITLLKRVIRKINTLWPNTVHDSAIELIDSAKITAKERRIDRWISTYFGNYTLMSALMILTIPGLKRKLGVLFEQAFPSPDYMRCRYPTKKDSALIFLYLTRITIALNFISRKIIDQDKHFE